MLLQGPQSRLGGGCWSSCRILYRNVITGTTETPRRRLLLQLHCERCGGPPRAGVKNLFLDARRLLRVCRYRCQVERRCKLCGCGGYGCRATDKTNFYTPAPGGANYSDTLILSEFERGRSGPGGHPERGQYAMRALQSIVGRWLIGLPTSEGPQALWRYARP